MIQEKFDVWAVVELFGHSKIAGKCSEYNLAGTNMLRVDVPETTKQPPFSKLYGSSAIYAVSIVDESTAKATAERLHVAPLDTWDVREMLKRNSDLVVSVVSGPTPPHIEYTDPNELEF